jgi:hypothetical protein
MIGPGVIPTFPPASRSRGESRTLHRHSASQDPSEIIACAPFDTSSAGWNANFTLPPSVADASRRAASGSDCDVPVVSARVHLAGMPRAVRNVVGFFDRQRVHIGTEQHAAPPPVAARVLFQRHNTGLADAGCHLIVESPQPFGDERGGARFLESELRMLVNVAPRGN